MYVYIYLYLHIDLHIYLVSFFILLLGMNIFFFITWISSFYSDHLFILLLDSFALFYIHRALCILVTNLLYAISTASVFSQTTTHVVTVDIQKDILKRNLIVEVKSGWFSLYSFRDYFLLKQRCPHPYSKLGKF